MSEEEETPKPDTEEEQVEDNAANDIKISFEGLEELDQAELIKRVENLATIVEKQNEKISQMEEVTIKSQQEAEQSKKQVLLDRLEQAGYNAEDFKEMDLASLDVMIKGLSRKDGKIKIPKKADEEEDKPLIGKHNVEIYDPETRTFVNFYDKKTGKTPGKD